jgi:hypothetical protein
MYRASGVAAEEIKMAGNLSADRINDRGREAACIRNGLVSAVIDARGGMMPEFGLVRGKGLLNAHWIPDFRSNSGEPWIEAKHAGFWKAKLLYNLAGDFPCCPNFGPPCTVDGVQLPPHGWTANEDWKIEGTGVDEEARAAWAAFSLASAVPSMPLSFRKLDMVFEGSSSYISVLDIKNHGPRPLSVNVARHNTLGAPFLQAEGRISLGADLLVTAPEGTEFDSTGRLARGVEFGSLDQAPLRDGGTADLSHIPGIIGYTDFVTGRVPKKAELGWICTTSPSLGLAYVCFFPGEKALPAGEISLGFNDLWMQYGGRAFTPWAAAEGHSDRSFCLGVENATGAYANGLEYSRAHPEILGNATIVEIPANGTRRLCYGAALLETGKALAAEGIAKIEVDGAALVLKGKRSHVQLEGVAGFEAARKFANRR